MKIVIRYTWSMKNTDALMLKPGDKVLSTSDNSWDGVVIPAGHCFEVDSVTGGVVCVWIEERGAKRTWNARDLELIQVATPNYGGLIPAKPDELKVGDRVSVH